MDIEKIMAEERKRVEKVRAEDAKMRARQDAELKRNATALEDAWTAIRGAVSELPGIKISEELRRAMAGNALLVVGDLKIAVAQADAPPRDFAAKEWRKALDMFVRSVARNSR